MSEQKVLVRVVGFSYIRIIGANVTVAASLFAKLKKTWSEKGVTLHFRRHDEIKEWFHIIFSTHGLSTEKISERANHIKYDAIQFLESMSAPSKEQGIKPLNQDFI